MSTDDPNTSAAADELSKLGLAPDQQPIHIRELATANGWTERVIGTSVEDIPIRAWWPTGTPTRVIYAAIHGEEAPTLLIAHHLLRTIRAEDACAVVVPVANPDGVLHGTRQNARGVDLNRNWPSDGWRSETQPTYWPTTETRRREFRTQYSSPGSAPGSEPETRALMELINEVKPATVIDIHAPLDLVIAHTTSSIDLAEHLAEPASMRVVKELDIPVYGDTSSWCVDHDIDTITYEIEMGPLPQLWRRHREGLARAVLTP